MSHQDGLGSSARTSIHSITGAQVQTLIAKLDVLLPFLPSHLPLRELLSSDDYTPGEVAKGGGGKHVLQEASILGNLRRIGALTTGTAVAIELGAGTARLSERLQRVTSGRLAHVLVDRQIFTLAQCRDGAMRNRSSESQTVERVVGDVASLDLGRYCYDSSSSDGANKKCVCMSKHLCGPACDLAVASLGRLPTELRPPFAFATCCHYLCTWECFAGKNFWTTLGLTEEDFEVAVAASQWYSLKNTSPREEAVAPSAEVSGDGSNGRLQKLSTLANVAAAALARHEAQQPQMPSEEFERTFSREEKAKLGSKLKRLLDLSRAAGMQELGYDVELVLYTTRSIENRLLVASNPNYF